MQRKCASVVLNSPRWKLLGSCFCTNKKKFDKIDRLNIDEFFSCLRRRRIVCLEEIIRVAVFSRRRKNFYVEEIDLKALVALC